MKVGAPPGRGPTSHRGDDPIRRCSPRRPRRPADVPIRSGHGLRRPPHGRTTCKSPRRTSRPPALSSCSTVVEAIVRRRAFRGPDAWRAQRALPPDIDGLHGPAPRDPLRACPHGLRVGPLGGRRPIRGPATQISVRRPSIRWVAVTGGVAPRRRARRSPPARPIPCAGPPPAPAGRRAGRPPPSPQHPPSAPETASRSRAPIAPSTATPPCRRAGPRPHGRRRRGTDHDAHGRSGSRGGRTSSLRGAHGRSSRWEEPARARPRGRTCALRAGRARPGHAPNGVAE